jgi:peroxiredoxin
MKLRISAVLAVSGLLVTAFVAPAAEPAQTSDAKSELKEVVSKVQTKLKDGKKTEADLAENIKEFDDLLAKHKGEKTDDVAQILQMKAMLYAQVLEDPETAIKLLEQVKTDFPETRQGKSADKSIEAIKTQGEAKKVRSTLVKGAKFPDFSEKDMDGKPLSIGNYKGKVVLLDFWATWCGPCVAELPNVQKTYKNYHGKGFEIVGISLDSDEQKLKTFIKDKEMPWVQYFDGKGWSNKLARQYGVSSIPATYLLDGEGKIIDSNLRGEALEKAVADALAKK